MTFSYVLDRLGLFSTQYLSLAVIAATTLLYLNFLGKRFQEWLKPQMMSVKTAIMYSLVIEMPFLFLFAPAWEELFFRGPLLLLYPSWSAASWPAILGLSVLFGTLHVFNPVPSFSSKKSNDQSVTWAEAFKKEKERKQKGRAAVIFRCVRVILASITGIGLSYMVLTYQTLWKAFYAHALLNMIASLVLPLVVPLVMLLVMFAVVGFRMLFEAVGPLLRKPKHWIRYLCSAMYREQCKSRSRLLAYRKNMVSPTGFSQ